MQKFMRNITRWCVSLWLLGLSCAYAETTTLAPAMIQLQDEGTTQGRVQVLNCVGSVVVCEKSGMTGTINVSGGAGAPSDATYWTGNMNGSLSAEHNLGGLNSGLVINSNGTPVAYTGTTCTGQVLRLLNASGAGTCVTITSAYVDTSIWTGVVSSGLLKATSQGVLARAVSGTDYVIPAGNVATTTALAANGANCSGNNFALGVDASGVGECAQPAFSNLSGSATDGQIPNSITLDNLTQVTTRAISDTTGTLAVGRGGTGQTTITTNQLYVGASVDTLAAKTIPSCSNGTTSKLLFDNATQEFSCGTDQGGAGGFVVTETEIDFTDALVYFDGVFTVTDALVSGTSKLIVSQSGAAATGKEENENEMDGLILRAAPGSGEFTLYVTCPEGCHGKYKVNYSFS